MAEEAAPPVAAPVVEQAPAAPPIVEAPPVADGAPPAETPTSPDAAATPPSSEATPPAVEPPAAPKDLLKEATVEEKPAEAAPADKPAEVKPEEKPVDAKPEEKPADAPEKATDAAPPADPVAPQRLEPLAEYKYEVPEGVTFTEDRRTEFHSAIEEGRNGNLQPLLDLHHQAGQELRQALEQGQRDTWNKTLETWHGETMADPDIGGAKFAGVSRRVAQMRDMYVSTHERGSDAWKADMAAFNHMLDSTGVGNHPAMWKFLNNWAAAHAEPVPPAHVNPKPAPQGKRGAEAMYDNPRSPRPNGPN